MNYYLIAFIYLCMMVITYMAGRLNGETRIDCAVDAALWWVMIPVSLVQKIIKE